MKKENIILIIIAVMLAIYPLAMSSGDFVGADDKAKDAISEVSPNYVPWFKSLWEPPSSEVESLLFALQAAIGAGFIGYFFGRYSRGGKAV